jgi:subtilisin family serine protease
MITRFRVGLRLTAAAGLALFAVGCAEQTTEAPLTDSPAFGKARGGGSSSYVLSAGKWKRAQTRAVERAGGTVVFGHEGSGIGMATSSNPDFLEDALASRAFRSGQLDEMVEWQPPVEVMEADGAGVTPGDEGFFPLQWNMLAIDAPSAWATGADGSGARVAVLDGGINDTHLDLAGQVDVACSASFVDGQPFNNDVGFFWHGTHVAGIVAAADNGIGVIGVAPGATIMAVKVLHSGSGSFGAVIGGILFASDPTAFGVNCQRADIINMSLGALFPKNAVGGGPLVAAMNKAVNFAASNGVLVISAAGNNGVDLGQARNFTFVPAESGSGIAVSATGPVDFILGGTNFRRFASYSNYGESLVTLAGPGGDFVSPNPLWFYDMVLSLCGGLGGNFYCFAAGTSMASPAAAGVAALIVGENPGISLGKLKNALKNSADDEGKKGHDEFYGHGFVNAYNAVK